MSLNDLLGRMTDKQFLSLTKFGETVTFYKGADAVSGTPVNVIWDADALPGSNEVDGDGRVMERRSGRRSRQSIVIECSSDVNVTENADPPDRFVRAGEVALVKRIMAYDSGGMQSVLCIRSDGQYDRGKYRMG